MQTRQLGGTDMRVGVLGFGSAKIGSRRPARLLVAAGVGPG